MSREHFGYQAPVTLVGVSLRAKECDFSLKESGIYLVQNSPLRHQLLKRPLVLRPVVRLAVGIPNLRARSEHGLVVVGNSRDSIKEKSKVGILREPCELPDTILPDVNQPLYTSLLKKPEKLFRILLREADGEYR